VLLQRQQTKVLKQAVSLTMSWSTSAMWLRGDGVAELRWHDSTVRVVLQPQSHLASPNLGHTKVCIPFPQFCCHESNCTLLISYYKYPLYQKSHSLPTSDIHHSLLLSSLINSLINNGMLAILHIQTILSHFCIGWLILHLLLYSTIEMTLERWAEQLLQYNNFLFSGNRTLCLYKQKQI